MSTVTATEYFQVVKPGLIRMRMSGLFMLFMDGMVPGQSEYVGPYWLQVGEEYSALWAKPVPKHTA